MLATMASQALLVVLSPTIVATADDLGASVGAVGQARSIAAGAAIAASIAIAGRIDAVGVSRLLGVGAALAVIACGVLALSPTILAFLLAHVLVGIAFACLLSAGFAGVAAFPPERRSWAIGYVVGGNALAWIVVSPLAGAMTESLSWRAAEAIPAVVGMAALMTARAAPLAPGAPAGGHLRALLGERSARRWIGAELIAYAAWAALLTFVGAFFIQRLGVREAAAGWLLAGGAAAHFFASSRSGALATLVPRRALVAGSSLLLAALLAMELGARAPVLAVAAFWLMCLAAGARTPASSGLGLAQAPDRPGAMMAARSGTTQLGYLLGAAIGGVVIAGPGYGTLGIVLAVGMTASALLILRVDDPLETPPVATRTATSRSRSKR
jgi:predicted MFS family arabinose efflux permease